MTGKDEKAQAKDSGSRTRAANARSASRHTAANADKAKTPATSSSNVTVRPKPAPSKPAATPQNDEPIVVEVVDHAAAEAQRQAEEQANEPNDQPKVKEGPDGELQVHSDDPKHQHIQGPNVGDVNLPVDGVRTSEG